MSRILLPSRRTLLRGLLGGAAVTVGLPPLEAFFDVNGTAYADGCSLPRRFGMFFWGNGHLPNFWIPQGEGAGAAWELPPILAPLANVKEAVTLVTGMEVKVLNRYPHGSGVTGFLTGLPPVDLGGSDFTFAGPTIDQVIAQEIGGDTRFRSLQSGVRGTGDSYTGPNAQNPTETSSYALFERIFGAGFTAPGEEPIFDPKLGLRRSVLDAVMADSAALRTRVSASDASRLDQHLTGIRELELRLARMEEDPPDLAACSRPDAPAEDFPDLDGRPQMSAINRAMCDLLAMALACDQTRVFGHYFSGRVSNLLYPGADAGHHQLTHDEPGEQPQTLAILLQIMEEFAYLLERLRAVDEGEGTLLDHCIVLGTSEQGDGRTHSLEEFPIVLAGGGCGRLARDLHYRSFDGGNAGRVMLSILRAMGITRADWGVDDTFTTDGLGEIEL